MKSIYRMFGFKQIRYSSKGRMPKDKKDTIYYDYTQWTWEFKIRIPFGIRTNHLVKK